MQSKELSKEPVQNIPNVSVQPKDTVSCKSEGSQDNSPKDKDKDNTERNKKDIKATEIEKIANLTSNLTKSDTMQPENEKEKINKIYSHLSLSEKVLNQPIECRQVSQTEINKKEEENSPENINKPIEEWIKSMI